MDENRSEKILKQLQEKYPGKKAYDLDGRGMHFVCEIEPVDEHPEYDRAIEVIISSKSHKHIKMTQYYKILKGDLEFHVGDETVNLHEGDTYIVEPGLPHWGKGDECWLEIYSTPGWTKKDHIQLD